MEFNYTKFLTENKLTPVSRLGGGPSEEENQWTSTPEEEIQTDTKLDIESPEHDIDKYLSMKSAEAILREIEQEVNRSSMEQKIARLKEVIATFDTKISTLEEAEDFKNFINTSKLKEMKRMGMKLKGLQEKMEKKYQKRYTSK